jgi:hypothetical protein
LLPTRHGRHDIGAAWLVNSAPGNVTKRHIFDDEFKALAPLALANGLNPYGPNDPNVSIMFKLAPAFYRAYIQKRTGFTGGARVLDLP